MRTAQEIIDQTNTLARELYSFLGYRAREGYRFDRAMHPEEKLAWQMACAAQSRLTDTDVSEAMDELDDAG